MENFYDELLIELECPVCTNYMVPPIRQCETGHSICEPCRNRLRKCPLCQKAFTESKNISLEALARKMHYPCINRLHGCDVKLSLEERELHEINCVWKGFKCAMERCPWVGKLEEIGNHWASKKLSSKPYKASNVCHTKIKAESLYVNLIEVYGQHFWFKCKVSKGKIFWAVQFIGPNDVAIDYYYEIEIFKPGQAKRKILLSDYCQSIDIDNNDLFKENVCMNSTIEMLSQYTGGDDQLLIYYMRVCEVNKGEESGENADAEQSHRPRHKGHRHHRPHSRGSAHVGSYKQLGFELLQKPPHFKKKSYKEKDNK